jgi:hypothetical protein
VVEKVSGVEVLRELMAANGLRQKDLADDLGGESIVPLVLQEKDNSTGNRWKSSAVAFTFLLQYFSKVSGHIVMIVHRADMRLQKSDFGNSRVLVCFALGLDCGRMRAQDPKR